MKILPLFLCISLISHNLFSSQEKLFHEQFSIKELNYENEQEVADVCEIFQDEQIQKMTNANPDLIKRLITSSPFRFLACTTIEDPLITCATLGFEDDQKDNTALFLILAVKHDFQQKGIASSLMIHAEQKFIDHSVQQIFMHVDPRNKSALACYKKQGFYKCKLVTHHKVCNDPDRSLYCMKKDLQSTTTNCYCLPHTF